MISPVATKNRHIELLQSMAYDSNTTIDCLLVAHNNALLAERLEMAFSDKSAALLQVPQGNWDLKNGDLVQAIGWAIEECHVQRIVLVGDSSASVSDRRAKLLGITEAVCELGAIRSSPASRRTQKASTGSVPGTTTDFAQYPGNSKPRRQRSIDRERIVLPI